MGKKVLKRRTCKKEAEFVGCQTGGFELLSLQTPPSRSSSYFWDAFAGRRSGGAGIFSCLCAEQGMQGADRRRTRELSKTIVHGNVHVDSPHFCR